MKEKVVYNLSKLQGQKGYILEIDIDPKKCYCIHCMNNVLENMNFEGFYYCPAKDFLICKKCEYNEKISCINGIGRNPNESHEHFFIKGIEKLNKGEKE